MSESKEIRNSEKDNESGKPESKPQTHPDSEVDPYADLEPDNGSKAEKEPEPEVDPDADIEPDTSSKAPKEPEPEVNLYADIEPDISSKTRKEPEPEFDPYADIVPDAKPAGSESVPSQAANGAAASQSVPKPIGGRTFLYFVRFAFLLSGASALIYEIVWQRVFVRLIGANTLSISLVVCSFMTGLLIGSFLGARLTKVAGSTRALVRLFAIVELVIGLSGVVSVNLCKTSFIQGINDVLGSCTAGNAGLLALLSALIAFLLILVPTTLMGATLPIVAALAASLRRRTDAELGLLYAFNTTGAVFGALSAGLQMLPLLGISQTLHSAASINVLSCIFAMLAAFLVPAPRQIEDGRAAAPAPSSASEINKRKPTNLMLVSGVVLFGGLLSLTMEIVWTRFLILIFGSSTYALCVVLSVFIAGMSLGAWMIALMARKVAEKAALFPFLIATTAILLGANMFQYQQLPSIYLHCRKFLLDLFEPGFSYDTFTMVICASWLVFPAATLMGTLFPLALETVARRFHGTTCDVQQQVIDQHILAKRTANLYAINLIGCMLGALVTGLFTLPLMGRTYFSSDFSSGIEITTILVACFYILLSFLVAFSVQQEPSVALRTLRNVIFLTALAFALVIMRPAWNAALMTSGIAYIPSEDLRRFEVSNILEVLALKPNRQGNDGEKLLFYREGTNSTVAVGTRPAANINYLKSNGKSEASIPINPLYPAPESDLPTQALLGLLPALLSPQTAAGPSTEAGKDSTQTGNNKAQTESATGTNSDRRLDTLPPQKGLVIGYGTGTTCGELLSIPWIGQVAAVEIEDSIWAADRYFQPSNGLPLRAQWTDNRRMVPVTGDARNFLSTHKEKYDFIVSQPAEPWLSGAADLYTQEFYQLAKSRLREGGVFCQWVPLYAVNNHKLRMMLETFRSVYPNVFVWHPKRAGEVILTGSERQRSIALPPLSHDMLDRSMMDDTERIAIDGPFDLLSCIRLSPADLAERLNEKTDYLSTEINTDDNLAIEFSRDRELSPEELNVEIRLSNFANFDPNKPGQEKVLKKNPENQTERALALSYARRKRFDSAPFTDTYYFSILKGSVPNPRVPPPLMAPVHPYLSKDSNDFAELESEHTDKALIDYRYWLHMGETKKTIECFKKISPSVMADAKSYDANCDLATGYLMVGDYKNSLSFFQKALSKKGGARGLAGVGLCYWLLHDDKKAEMPLQVSLKQDPNQFLPRLALAQILCKTGREDEGLQNMRTTSQVNTASPLPGIFVTAYFVNKENYASAADNLHLVLRRKHVSLPETLALGFLIAHETKRQAVLLNSYSQHYKKMTGTDITVEGSKKIVQEILSEPFGVRRY